MNPLGRGIANQSLIGSIATWEVTAMAMVDLAGTRPSQMALGGTNGVDFFVQREREASNSVSLIN